MQASRQDVERVVSAAEVISGDHAKADEWLIQPLTTFDGKTPLQLVAEGRADAVIGYLRSIASGFVGYEHVTSVARQSSATDVTCQDGGEILGLGM